MVHAAHVCLRSGPGQGKDMNKIIGAFALQPTAPGIRLRKIAILLSSKKPPDCHQTECAESYEARPCVPRG